MNDDDDDENEDDDENDDDNDDDDWDDDMVDDKYDDVNHQILVIGIYFMIIYIYMDIINIDRLGW